MNVSQLFSVKGKVALVTGGGRGIGSFIAKALVANGATVYISSRKKEECETTANELTKLGPGKCFYIVADISTDADVARLVEELSRKTPVLHILVNNAGNTWGAPLESYPSQAWERVWSLNVKGLFQVTRGLLPLLKKAATAQDPARVINLGSIDGIRTTQVAHYAYSTSKAAVHHLTKVLANELSPYQITVNAIAAGPFATKMLAGVMTAAGGEEAISSTVPIGRMGRDTDAGGMVLFLASAAGSYVTGATIPLDGGILVKASL